MCSRCRSPRAPPVPLAPVPLAHPARLPCLSLPGSQERFLSTLAPSGQHDYPRRTPRGSRAQPYPNLCPNPTHAQIVLLFHLPFTSEQLTHVDGQLGDRDEEDGVLVDLFNVYGAADLPPPPRDHRRARALGVLRAEAEEAGRTGDAPPVDESMYEMTVEGARVVVPPQAAVRFGLRTGTETNSCARARERIHRPDVRSPMHAHDTPRTHAPRVHAPNAPTFYVTAPPLTRPTDPPRQRTPEVGPARFQPLCG